MPAHWTRDEIVLACDLISRNNWKGLRANTQQVQALSKILQNADIHRYDDRPLGFRSPSSVQRKTYDLATQHPDYTGVKTRGNQLDIIVLQEYLNNTAEMQRLAAGIRTRLGQANRMPE